MFLKTNQYFQTDFLNNHIYLRIQFRSEIQSIYYLRVSKARLGILVSLTVKYHLTLPKCITQIHLEYFEMLNQFHLYCLSNAKNALVSGKSKISNHFKHDIRLLS